VTPTVGSSAPTDAFPVWVTKSAYRAPRIVAIALPPSAAVSSEMPRTSIMRPLPRAGNTLYANALEAVMSHLLQLPKPAIEGRSRLKQLDMSAIAAAAALIAVGESTLGAQAPTVYFACYVPSSGTVYRIKAPNTPQTCGSTTKKGVVEQHVEFSWTDGAGADHGALTGLTEDDHTQYLLSNGVRNSLNGFAVTGSMNSGTMPAVSGEGTRLLWYPKKAAFRAGWVLATHWDDVNIGRGSVAMGISNKASGEGSVALGTGSFATGAGALALMGGDATGDASVAISAAMATAFSTIAIGNNAYATGEQSVALGSMASTNAKRGAFVYGDASVPDYVNAASDNQFVVRASRFWFGADNNVTATAGRYIETSTGAYLSSGGTWTNSSDSARKTAFRDVDGDSVLARIAAMPVRTWSYRDEDSTVRHMGPTAQDFRTAFSLGQSDKAIATVDADGVSIAAIQALLKRTDRLARDNESLGRANGVLRSELDLLNERVRSLEAQRSQLAARGGDDTTQRTNRR